MRQTKESSTVRFVLLALLALLLLLFAAACRVDIVSVEYGGTVRAEDDFGRASVGDPLIPAWSMPVWERPAPEEDEAEATGAPTDEAGDEDAK